MNKLLLILSLTLALSSCNQETQYCGTVIEKFRTDAGYKSRPEAHVVFYCDAIHKNIDVEVTFNCYANTEKGQEVCFSLTEHQLNR